MTSRGSVARRHLTVPIDSEEVLTMLREARERHGEADRSLELTLGRAVVTIEALAERTLQLQTALDTRVVIEQAKGTLMASDHLTADEAFEELVRRSQMTNRKLRDVAAEVVAATVAGVPCGRSTTSRSPHQDRASGVGSRRASAAAS